MPCSDHLPGSEGRNSVGRNKPQQKPQPGCPQDAGPRLSNDLELIWWIIVMLPMFSCALAVVSHPAGALCDPARTWSRIAPGDTAEPQHRAPVPWGQWCAQGREAPSLMCLYSCKMMLVCRQHLGQMGVSWGKSKEDHSGCMQHMQPCTLLQQARAYNNATPMTNDTSKHTQG